MERAKKIWAHFFIGKKNILFKSNLMKSSLRVGFILLQFLGRLITEWVEKKPLRLFYRGGKALGKTRVLRFEAVYQASWWVKTLIGLLGVGGLIWIYFICGKN